MLYKIRADVLKDRIEKDGRSMKEIGAAAGVGSATMYRMLKKGDARKATIEAVRKELHPALRAKSIYLDNGRLERQETEKASQKPLQSFTVDKSKVRENISKINRQDEINSLKREVKALRNEVIELRSRTLWDMLFSK